MDWTVPDYVIVPTASAEGLYGSRKGFKEFSHLGLIDSLPRMVAASPFGCDPLREAMDRNLDKIPILERKKTIALSIGARATGHQGLVALRESQGMGISVKDEEILEAQRLLALDGIFAESASAASAAAAIKTGRLRKIDRDATIVCVITASGLKMPDDAKSYLPELPVVEPDFEVYREVLEKVYYTHLK